MRNSWSLCALVVLFSVLHASSAFDRELLTDNKCVKHYNKCDPRPNKTKCCDNFKCLKSPKDSRIYTCQKKKVGYFSRNLIEIIVLLVGSQSHTP